MRTPSDTEAPTLLTADECEALARRVFGMVSGSRVQVQVGCFIGAGIRFARGDAHMASEHRSVSVDLGLEVGGNRQARGSTNQVDEAGLQALVREVEALVREQRSENVWSEEDFLPYLAPQEFPKGPRIYFDSTTKAMSGEAHAEVFRRATDAAEAAGLVAAGRVWVSGEVRAMLNTRGFWGYERSTYSDFSLTARTKDGTGSGWAWSGHEDWSRVKVEEVIARAVELGRRSAKPVAVEPGRYTVILEPPAVAALVEPIASVPTAFWSAAAADGGGTVFSKEPVGTNKIGLQMIDRRLRMVSDPWDPERPASLIGSGIGTNWRPLAPVTWFEGGVLRNLAYVPSYAKEKGVAPVLDPRGVRLAADGPPQTLEEMIASTKRGIWVNRLSNLAVLHNPSLLLTGTTRDGTFLIENGKITKAIKNFRFTESPFFVLNKLEAWGEPVRASAEVVAPRLKLHDFNFSSLTDAV